MDKIRIHLGESGWLATYEGPHAKRIVELFGQATLPTPFTSTAPVGMVISAIRNLNPGARVSHLPRWEG